MRPSESVSYAMHHAYLWGISKTAAGVIHCQPKYPERSHRVEHPYTLGEFGAVHANMTQWITDAMFALNYREVRQSDIDIQVEFWTSPLIVLSHDAVKHEGNTHARGKDFYLVNAAALDLEDDVLRVINGCWFSSRLTRSGLLCAEERHFGSLSISTSWLDTAYPGWRARYTAGENLGLRAQQMREMVFGIGPYASAGHASLPCPADLFDAATPSGLSS